LAKLWSNHKIEFLNNHIVEEDSKALFELLKNSRNYDSVTVRPQKEYTPSQKRTLQDFYRGFTNQPPTEHDAKALANETQKAIQEALEKYHEMEKQIRDYPFCKPFEDAVQEIQRISKKETDWFFTQLQDCKDTLLMHKEEVLDPITTFLKSSQKSIFDQIKQFLSTEKDNLGLYLNKAAEVKTLQSVIQDPKCYLNSSLNNANTVFSSLKNELDNVKTQKKETLQQELNSLLSSSPPDIQQKPQFQTACNRAKHSLQDSTTIATWETALRTLADTIQKLQTPDQPSEQEPRPGSETDPPGQTVIPGNQTKPPIVNETITLTDLMVNFSKPLIENDHDIDGYIQNLTDALKKSIRAGKRIQWKKVS
jgi:Zn-finger protein